MRLAELSERSGVTTATIKYYLREGLLPPGRRITATQAEYGEDHLRRLRFVRALIQIGKVPVAAAREVLAAVEDESLTHHQRLGAATFALPHGPAPDENDPAVATARREVDSLMAEVGWRRDIEDYGPAPAYWTLVTAVAALTRLGYPSSARHLEPYARLAAQQAVHDMDLLEAYDTPLEQAGAAVALTVLLEPVLLSLRRLAEVEESRRREAVNHSA
ncbi:MerR family transcriptional regulator [Streptomyces cadmiisoli]|uniref:Transcriptional regulator n=1 Tax=Streptomyces cadmiisoli TaxID=2184053 RepID=A0A2Z4J902_9ACTN|nr:MerR family transcriptional regulator [Streptomyces cadmiisoli]AWW41644.1 transcriptional regulator [Streptomyces cadmiisoli]